MNGYVCFYNGKRIEVYAETTAEAQRKAAEQLKLKEKQRYKITVMLAEIKGEQYTHTPVD